MDNKLIIAIIIVALIGVVAATYQGQSNPVVRTLTGAQTEDAGVTDVVGVESDSQTPAVSEHETVVTEDGNLIRGSSNSNSQNSNTNKNTQTNTNSNKNTQSNQNSNNSQQNQVSSTNTTQNGTTTQTTNKSSNSQVSGFNPKLSSAQILSIAQKESSMSGTNPQVVDRKVINGVPYYFVVVYKSGRAVGELEIDGNTGVVTGGAFENEVQPNTVINQSSSNSTSSNTTVATNTTKNSSDNSTKTDTTTTVNTTTNQNSTSSTANTNYNNTTNQSRNN